MPGAITGLVGAGGGGVIGGAVVRLVLDSSQFNSGLAQAQGRLQSIGAGMSRIGSTLTRGVTVPLVAAGAVATKMALDFNKAFVQIQTLASKGGMSIEQMKTQVLALAQATGQDPNGLANALYQVLSAGKAAASQAFPILTAAAKGAAIGMGNVNDISKVLTSTMNAYGPKVISAGEAMDILTQATHDSAAEADALATSIGPVIGIAAQAGISFKEVAAAMATATNAGISTERAATGLRFLIGSLQSPTTAAKDALDRYGVSVQELGRMLDQQGLIGTLQSLAKTFDLTTTRGAAAFKALVGGQRGFVAAASLVGKTADQATTEVQKLGDAAGVTQQKFELWGQTITGKNAIALGKLKVAAIQLGEKLIPIFEHVVNAVTDLVDAFSHLSPAMQGAVTKGLLFAALAGPFLKLGGVVTGLISKFGSLASAASSAASAGGGAAGAGAALPAAPAVAAAGAGIAEFSGVAALAVGLLNGIHVALDSSQPAWKRFAAGVDATGVGLADLGRHLTGVLHPMQGVAGVLGPLVQRFITTRAEASRLQQVMGGPLSNAWKQWGAALQRTTHLTDQQKQAIAGQIGTLAHYGGSLNRTQSQQLAMAIAAGNAKRAMDILTQAINHIPTEHKTKIDVQDNATSKIKTIAGSLNALPNGVTIPVNVVYTTSGRPPVGAPQGGVSRVASGGIIHGASGFVTQAPTYMVGEGSSSTFAGRGAEAVIPLNDRGIGILAKAMRKAGGGHGGINVTINTQGAMDPNQLAASVSRHLARTIREEALV